MSDLGITDDILRAIFEDPELRNALQTFHTINLSGNEIKSIDCLSGLTNLQSLSLYRNQITSIDCLSGLTNLQHLDISNNQITSLEGLSGLTNLQNLDISNNQITSIEEDVLLLLARIDCTVYGNPGNLRTQLNNIQQLSTIQSALKQCNVSEEMTKIVLQDSKLQDFILKAIPLTKHDEEAMRYVFTQIKEGDQDILPTIYTSLGNCNTPVKTLLSQMYIKSQLALDHEIDQTFLQQQALQLYIIAELKQFALNVNDGEVVEIIAMFCGLLFSQYYINNPEITIPRILHDNDLCIQTRYQRLMIEHVQMQNFLNTFCVYQGEENGKKVYTINQKKIDEITTEYKTSIGYVDYSTKIKRQIEQTNEQIEQLFYNPPYNDIETDDYEKEGVIRDFKLEMRNLLTGISNPLESQEIIDRYYADMVNKIEQAYRNLKYEYNEEERKQGDDNENYPPGVEQSGSNQMFNIIQSKPQIQQQQGLNDFIDLNDFLQIQREGQNLERMKRQKRTKYQPKLNDDQEEQKKDDDNKQNVLDDNSEMEEAMIQQYRELEHNQQYRKLDEWQNDFNLFKQQYAKKNQLGGRKI